MTRASWQWDPSVIPTAEAVLARCRRHGGGEGRDPRTVRIFDRAPEQGARARPKGSPVTNRTITPARSDPTSTLRPTRSTWPTAAALPTSSWKSSLSAPSPATEAGCRSASAGDAP